MPLLELCLHIASIALTKLLNAPKAAQTPSAPPLITIAEITNEPTGSSHAAERPVWAPTIVIREMRGVRASMRWCCAADVRTIDDDDAGEVEGEGVATARAECY